MSDEQLDAFCEDIDAICEKHGAWMSGDSNIESVIMALGEVVSRQREAQTHPLVLDLLSNVVANLRASAMDYYVSTK